MELKAYLFVLPSLICVLTNTVGGVAVAQTDGTPETSESPKVGASTSATGWVATCATPQNAGELRCEMTNTVVINPSNRRFLGITIRSADQQGNMVMIAALPHGVLFTAPITVKFDGRGAGSFVPYSSDQSGAFATFPLAGDVIDVMKTAGRLTIEFESATSQRFTVDVPLNNFAAVYQKLSNSR